MSTPDSLESRVQVGFSVKDRELRSGRAVLDPGDRTNFPTKEALVGLPNVFIANSSATGYNPRRKCMLL